MALSSINFKKAKSYSSSHNLRSGDEIKEASYLLPKEHRLKNELWRNPKSDKEIFDAELSQAKRKGGRVPKLENSRWEGVLNLNKNHTLEDVKKVADHIAKKFNLTTSEISVHRDEGKIVDGKVHYNFHAHLNFVTYKDGKQNWRKEHIKPENLSELQTEVAELLNMERGKKNSKSIRLEHREYREAKRREENNLEALEELKEVIKSLRAELKASKAGRESYAELEQTHKELKIKILNKSLDTENLKKDLSEARETILKQKTTIYSQKSSLDVLEQDMSELKAKNTSMNSAILDVRNLLPNPKDVKNYEELAPAVENYLSSMYSRNSSPKPQSEATKKVNAEKKVSSSSEKISAEEMENLSTDDLLKQLGEFSNALGTEKKEDEKQSRNRRNRR